MVGFFTGKVVIVTGSSSGIGQETAVRFAKKGAKVTITGRNEKALNATKNRCIKGGAKEDDIHIIIGDVLDDSFAATLVNCTAEHFGALDVLVNCAGASIADESGKQGVEQAVDVFDQTMALNTRVALVVTQFAIPHLEKTKGAVINVSSCLAKPFLYWSAPYYSVAKAALDALTIQMAGSLINKGIRVNGVSPGVIKTNFFSNAMGAPRSTTDGMYDSLTATDNSLIPLGRVGAPEDIAKLILFLSDRSQSEFVVGQIYAADGGMQMKNMLMSRGPVVQTKPGSA